MEYMRGPGDFYVEEDTAVTLGKFDGLHRGHQKLVSRIRGVGDRGCKSVVFTLNRMENEQLLTEEERKSMTEKLGVDYLLDCPLVPEISGMEPEAFVEKILIDKLHAKYLAVGTDFRFGCQRRGDSSLLRELQKKYGFVLEVIQKEQYQKRDISSTYIKEELAAGHLETVNTLLGYTFFVSGEVLHGGPGNYRYGLPAANLRVSARKLLPPNGIYLTRTIIRKEEFPGVTNIGMGIEGERQFRSVETYLFGFGRELPGEHIEVQFLKFLRPEKSFGSTEELHRQMDADISFGKVYFGE